MLEKFSRIHKSFWGSNGIGLLKGFGDISCPEFEKTDFGIAELVDAKAVDGEPLLCMLVALSGNMGLGVVYCDPDSILTGRPGSPDDVFSSVSLMVFSVV